MRFRFCGEADCPDWVLAEITMLSRLSSVKLKLLAHLVAQSIENPPLNIEKAEKLLSDSKLDADVDLKRCIACISFILTSSNRFNCDQTVLASELQQLGLPREHSQSIRKVFIDHCTGITAVLRERSLRVNKLDKVEGTAVPGLNVVEIDVQVNGEMKSVRMSQCLGRSLLNDLKSVRETMDEIMTSDHSCPMY